VPQGQCFGAHAVELHACRGEVASNSGEEGGIGYLCESVSVGVKTQGFCCCLKPADTGLPRLTAPSTPMHANYVWMKRKISAKEGAKLLLGFTVAEPPHRQTIMASLDSFGEIQKAKIRDEIMFLDVVVIANLMGTDRVKQHWPKSGEVLVEYLAALKETLETCGGNLDGFGQSLEAREVAYNDVLMKSLDSARFAVGCSFATLCGFENESLVEVAGMAEFVSVVNHVGDLLTSYKIV
jgi:hypothetical protein